MCLVDAKHVNSSEMQVKTAASCKAKSALTVAFEDLKMSD